MMGDRFGLGVRVAQRLGRAAVQRLPAALEQAVVGRVLDQRVLEAIVGLRWRALDKQEVGVGKPIQRRLQRCFIQFGDIAQQPHRRNRVQEPRRSAPPHAPALADRGAQQGTAARSAGWPEPALLAALKKQARHLLNEQRHAAGSLADPLDNLLR